MRVIAGIYKGRKLETPQDNKVRPTSDKVKEAMFSILMPYTQDAVVCDLFAGTGNLGIEALSRGAKKCYFVDESKESIRYVRENIKRCKAEDNSEIINLKADRAIKRIREKIDILIMDPPYDSHTEEETIELILENQLLSEDAIVLIEHRKEREMPENIGNLTKIKDRKYGSVVLSIYMC